MVEEYHWDPVVYCVDRQEVTVAAVVLDELGMPTVSHGVAPFPRLVNESVEDLGYRPTDRWARTELVGSRDHSAYPIFENPAQVEFKRRRRVGNHDDFPRSSPISSRNFKPEPGT